MRLKTPWLALAIALWAGSVLAHPPTGIGIKINGTHVEIAVTHAVKDPADHYIKHITVTLNGKIVVEQDFGLQTGNVQNALYNLPGLKVGDKLSVRADCSKGGSLTEEKSVE